MIKLNNKNITYVALADSNNSVKGVKEIWYADSANSVKLVYRRKDALIEGVDYEVHQWLVGDGSAHIDTNIILNAQSLKLDFYCTNSQSPGNICGNQNRYDNPTGSATIYYNNRAMFRFDIISTEDNYISVNSEDSNHIEVDTATNSAVVNGRVFTSSKTHTSYTKTFKLFWTDYAGSKFNGGIGLFKINDGTHTISLIPVKLLKSIPAKYDANGIARQTRECGMYDTINNLFYGNVASSGTFSVSDDS